MRAVRVWNVVPLIAAMSAAKVKLAAIPAELDKWEADVTALATPKKDDNRLAAKK